MSDDQDVTYLKAKLEEQAAEFESYKEQCKHIEEMLEEESQKKQSEIKQLKEEAIKKEKGEKMLKAQVSQLEAEVANLKTQLGESSKNSSQSASQKEQLDRVSQENALLTSKSAELESRLQQFTLKTGQLQSQLNQAHNKLQTLKKALSEAQQKAKSAPSPAQQSSNPSKDFSKLEQELKKAREKLASLQKDKSKLQKSLKDKQSQHQKVKHELQQKVRKLQQAQAHSTGRNKKQQEKPLKREFSQPKQLKEKQTILLTEHKLQQAKVKETSQQLQERVKQLEQVDKEQKIKLTNVMNEKTALLQKFKKLSQELEKERERREISNSESPQKTPSQEIMIDDAQIDQNHPVPSLRMDSLLLTKKHYISPFIQVKDNKLIKVYKSTKNGFEKSLGATRHRFDSVGYDSEAIAEHGAAFAKASLENGVSHSIVIYGSKRTSKKQMLAAILDKLRDWLLDKLDECQQRFQQEGEQENYDKNAHVLYMKHSADCQIHEQKQASNREQIAQLIDSLISPSSPSSPSKKPSKKQQKPKVRYLLFSFADNLRLEIITTSYLNPFIKQNQTFVDYLNTIVFSKLPNVLQSANTNYHIVTLVNPIVSQYQECKNTLSITMVPLADPSTNDPQPMTSTMVFSPAAINKDDLNDMTKKKLESFEKETEQAGLKVRKIEDECNYLRGRFEQLQIRLKNLINTHQQQNTYLKKSPVTLSYQKLLKFVNSVLARNTSASRTAISPNFGQTGEDYYQSQVNMYIQEDAKSLDGY